MLEEERGREEAMAAVTGRAARRRGAAAWSRRGPAGRTVPGGRPAGRAAQVVEDDGEDGEDEEDDWLDDRPLEEIEAEAAAQLAAEGEEEDDEEDDEEDVEHGRAPRRGRRRPGCVAGGSWRGRRRAVAAAGARAARGAGVRASRCGPRVRHVARTPSAQDRQARGRGRVLAAHRAAHQHQ